MNNEFIATINAAVNNFSDLNLTIGCTGSTYINIRFVPEQVVTNGNIMTIYSDENHFSFPIDEIVYDEVEDGFCINDGNIFVFIAA